MKHFTHIRDLGVKGVQDVLDRALDWKHVAPGEHLRGKVLGMVFFNPSLRTRTSFEAAMLRGGGHAVVLEVGGGVWKLEDREGAVMDSDKTEHLKEAVPVLGRYVDMLAVRAFSGGVNDDEDERDPVLEGFRKYTEVPLISMESAREHPCQGLADLLTLRESFGSLKGLPVTLTWAPHVKPLPKAVPNSFLLSAAAAGCEVHVAHPEGHDLHPAVIEEAQALSQEAGGSLSFGHSQEGALNGSRVLYAKAWGPSTGTQGPRDQGTVGIEGNRKEAEGSLFNTSTLQHFNTSSWMPTLRHFETMGDDAIFLHCLPVRRNVEVSDEVLDSPRSRVIDQAENRFHVQRVLLDMLLRGGNTH